MPPKGRVGASTVRRRQILDAALELFLEAGVGNCRLEDLLEGSGASVGSFYHHFGGKPGLAAALYLEILEGFHRDFLAELLKHKGARAGIRAMVGHHLRWVTQNPNRAAYLFQCLEPEVAAVCRDRENEMTTAFLGGLWYGQSDHGAVAGGVQPQVGPQYTFLYLWDAPPVPGLHHYQPCLWRHYASQLVQRGCHPVVVNG